MSAAHVVDFIFICAAFPAALFCWNLLLYREPPKAGPNRLPPVSVLIPARDEERSIEAAVSSVLASRGIEFEVVVLDDASTDRTSEIVSAIAHGDQRVRLAAAPPLPAGWNGKQHACHVLALLARHDVLCWLDADVRLAPGALAGMATFLDESRSELVSGFPYQETGTFLESLLLPLIHFVLLSYLPIAGMKLFRSPAFAAGCGQFMMVRRAAYQSSGGHAAIRSTMHDGISLPQLLRMHGHRTDLADLTSLASCRMYHNAGEVWRGLAKNATEGIAAPVRIVPFTVLLFLGQVAPLLAVVAMLLWPHLFAAGEERWLILGAFFASYLPRWIAVPRFRQKLVSALLHPAGIIVLLALQWYALARKLAGQPATWKQRAYNPG